MQNSIPRFTFFDTGINFGRKMSGKLHGDFADIRGASNPGEEHAFHDIFDLSKENYVYLAVGDDAGEDSKLTRSMYINSSNECKNMHLRYRCVTAERSLAEIFILRNTDHDQNTAFDIDLALDKNSKLILYLADLGGETHSLTLNAHLDEKAELEIKAIYLAEDRMEYDFNYVVGFHGHKAVSSLEVDGVLKDKARKRFRGTMDFKAGSIGSQGLEEEAVTMMSDEAKSLSVPLLLCTEDDVMGTHAASAGKIDQSKLFYLQSRGLSTEEAEKLIVLSKFDAVLSQIQNKDIRKALTDRVTLSMTAG